MTDKRVCFDFEIDFSNGGGLQGQDFRLDITNETISDAELADYIVRDLNLLMVADVRILKKIIITEAHKRKTPLPPKAGEQIKDYVFYGHTGSEYWCLKQYILE